MIYLLILFPFGCDKQLVKEIWHSIMGCNEHQLAYSPDNIYVRNKFSSFNGIEWYNAKTLLYVKHNLLIALCTAQFGTHFAQCLCYRSVCAFPFLQRIHAKI